MDVRLLSESDSRESFECGNEALDRFFRQFAGQNQFRLHVGSTYVAVEAGHVLGFATISAAALEIDDLPQSARKRLPRYPAPVLRLSRMGVALAHQGRGIGRALLNFTFMRAIEMMQAFGCVGVLVDAKPEAVDFYSRYGFEPLAAKSGAILAPSRPAPMFLSIKAMPGYKQR